jgi:hypothetical protein
MHNQARLKVIMVSAWYCIAIPTSFSPPKPSPPTIVARQHNTPAQDKNTHNNKNTTHVTVTLCKDLAWGLEHVWPGVMNLGAHVLMGDSLQDSVFGHS